MVPAALRVSIGVDVKIHFFVRTAAEAASGEVPQYALRALLSTV